MSPKLLASSMEKKIIEILEAAQICFAEKGFYCTSVDEIVKQANISKGAIYNYFPSKESIFITLMERKTEAFFKELYIEFAHMKTAKEKLKHLIHTGIQDFLSGDCWQRVHFEFWMYTMGKSDLQKMMRERYERYSCFFCNIIEEGQLNGEFSSSVDSTNLASIFWAAKDGISLHHMVLGDNQRLNNTVKDLEEYIFSML